jgi:hypothetical protein
MPIVPFINSKTARSQKLDNKLKATQVVLKCIALTGPRDRSSKAAE